MAPQSFRDDPTRVMHVAVLSVFCFFATIAVIFRFWARRIQRHLLELSDYFIIAGLIWALGLTLFTIHSNVYWELGGDVTEVGDPRAIQSLVIKQIKALLVGQITWAVSVLCIRASILCLYIRIFRTRSFRLACYVVHGVNVAFFVTVVLAACLLCRPIAFNWDHTIPGGTCGDQRALDLYIGIFNLFLDVALVALPMPVLWGLQMKISRKLVLSGMFGMGIIICVITLIRIRISAENHGSNAQEIYSLIALFTCLEALLGVINACLPVLKPVFNKFSDSRASSWLSSVMSGSIPVFMRPSQMGSAWQGSKSRPQTDASNTWRRASINKPPMPHEEEMARWHGTPTSAARSPPPRYVDNKAAGMMFSNSPGSAYKAIQSPTVARMNSDATSRRPPVPPKGSFYSPGKRWEPAEDESGIYVQRDWDVERGDSEETDRELVRGKRKKSGNGSW